jgi:hypothetical protein
MKKSMLVIMSVYTMLLQGMETCNTKHYSTVLNKTVFTITTQSIHTMKQVDFIIVGDNQQWLLRELYKYGKMEDNHIVSRIGEVLPVPGNKLYTAREDKDNTPWVDFNNENRNNDLRRAIEEKKVQGGIVLSVVEPCILYDRHTQEDELNRYCYTKQIDINSPPYKKYGMKAFKLAYKDLPTCYKKALHKALGLKQEQSKEPCSIALHVLGASTGLDNYAAFMISLRSILDYIKNKPLVFKEIWLCVKNDHFFNSGKTILSFLKLYEDLPDEGKAILSFLQHNQDTSYALNSHRPVIIEPGFYEGH